MIDKQKTKPLLKWLKKIIWITKIPSHLKWVPMIKNGSR